MAQGIYRKKGTSKLWMRFQNAAGEWQDESTGCIDENDARAVYAAALEAIRGGGQPEAFGPMTLKAYADRWIKERRERGLESVAEDEARLRDHVLPVLGKMALTEVEPRHIQAWIRDLKKKTSKRTAELLAPRTVRHCFFALKTLMTDAIADGRLKANPCVLKRGDLPKKKDKDPSWRATAVFSRTEVEKLISDHRIALDRRVWIALHFLGGLRAGEGSALKVRDYDERAEPLGRLVVSKAMDRTRKRVKGTKTEIPRDVPVHPTLAALLAEWKLTGWRSMMGRAPQLDDLLVPSRPTPAMLRKPDFKPKARGNSQNLKTFHRELELLELLPLRRFHDARRTFISLALADGATRDILRWVTHPVYEDQFDEYTSIPYASKCAEVAKLRIELLAGELVVLPKAANSQGPAVELATAPLQSRGAKKEAPQVQVLAAPQSGGVYGTRTCVLSAQGDVTSGWHDENPNGCARDDAPPGSAESNQQGSDCSGCSGKGRRYRAPRVRSEPARAVVVLRAVARASRGGR